MITTLFTLIQLALAQVYFDNMDEEIRYYEDPYYANYVREKVSHLEKEKKAQIKQQQASLAHKEKLEKDRLNYITERNLKRRSQIATDKASYDQYQKQRFEQKASTEKNRQDFVVQRNDEYIENSKIRSQQLAKMQQEVSRLPANYFDPSERPRVAKKKRKYP